MAQQRIDTPERLTARVAQLEKAVRLMVEIIDRLPLRDLGEDVRLMVSKIKYDHLDGIELEDGA